METAKSGLVQKCDPFWAVCKADREISPGGRQGRDVVQARREHRGLSSLPCLCGESHSWEDFPPCHVCIGKATGAVLLGSDGKARLGAGHGSPSLSHSPDRTRKPGPPALPVHPTETGKPQVLILVAAVCCRAEQAAAEVPPSVQNSLHTPAQTMIPERLRASCKPQSPTNEQFTCHLTAATREWKALSRCGGLNKRVRNIRELREKCQSWNSFERRFRAAMNWSNGPGTSSQGRGAELQSSDSSQQRAGLQTPSELLQ